MDTYIFKVRELAKAFCKTFSFVWIVVVGFLFNAHAEDKRLVEINFDTMKVAQKIVVSELGKGDVVKVEINNTPDEKREILFSNKSDAIKMYLPLDYLNREIKLTSPLDSIVFIIYDRIKNPATGAYQIVSSFEVKLILKLAEPKPENDTISALVYLGANFDMKQTLTPNTYYAEINVSHLPTRNEKTKYKWWEKRVGIICSVYRNSNNAMDSSKSMYSTRSYAKLGNSQDSLKLFQKIYDRKFNVSSDNFGLYNQIVWKLGDQKVLDIYLLWHTEVLWRKLTYKVTNTLKSVDTTVIRDSSLYRTPIRWSERLMEGYTVNTFDGYFAPGLMLKTTNTAKYDFLVKAVPFGLSATTSAVSSVYNPGEREKVGYSLNSFYLVNFTLRHRATNFAVGGEVRGLWSGQNPFIFLHLSKVFGFQKLIDFVAK